MKQLKKINRLNLRVLLVFLLLIRISVAQMDQYTRKSISFVDMLVYQKVKKTLDLETEQSFLQKIQRELILDRFDVNSLPAELGNRMRISLPKMQEGEDGDVLIQAMEAVILPEIQKILNVEKEIRARNFVSETERNSFIALKAKEYGVSSEHMLEVMNSAYIFLPFATELKVKRHHKDSDDDDDEDKVNVTVKAGLYIYKVNYTGDYSIIKMGEITGSAYASEERGKGGWSKAEKEAILETASSLGQTLKLELQKLEDFKLKAQLRKVKGRQVRFPLGKREGLKLDRPYYVGEWVENRKGQRRFEKDGFVRIKKVADNKTNPEALSSAYIIHKGDWARGMTIVEHPTLGIDLVIKPRLFKIDLREGYFLADDKHPAVFIKEKEADLFGTDIDLNINIAEQTKRLQSFLVLGGTFSFLGIENEVYNKDEGPVAFRDSQLDKNTAFFFNAYLGYLKKNYIGPLAIHREFLVGVQGLSYSNEYEIGDDDLSISAYGFGGRVNLGLEYALNIDWNLGVFAGFDYYPGLGFWRMKYNDSDDEDYFDLKKFEGFKYPKFKNVGPTFGIYLHYSLPSFGGSSAKMVDMVEESAKSQLF